ncbi:IclR family transcriptional regulator [Paracoccus sp. SSK6]|uniref:IclR family transcriptional regulator n=1 Tax=Paracoccus sp. SSK6 TaxID=3143131 RepID=UPI00321AA933
MGENRVDAVERALLILDAFQEGRTSLSLAALAQETGLYKSTILRLAGSLERFGYLARDDRGVYHLGPSLWRLGSLYRRSFDLEEHIRPELRRIVEATTETAAFYVREGAERICLYRLNSPRSVRHHLEEGTRLPLDRGAGGRVLLAYDGCPGEPYEDIRRTGHYTSLGERDPEIAAVSVPVFDSAGRLRGALSASALLGRFGPAARRGAIEALKESAARLRTSLL